MSDNHMKRLLIISYYWPPTGGSGVQRWLKFTKYFPKYGVQPVVFTPENPEQAAVDATLLNDIPAEAEVIKNPIIEPYSLFRKFTGNGKKGSNYLNPLNDSGNKSLKLKISLWIRANFFVPDPRIFWKRSSLRYLKKYLVDHPVDAIVSTGPPQSMHLLARDLHRETGISWIADFRDPWTRDFAFKHLPMIGPVLRLHKKQELSVLRESTAITSVTANMADEFREMLEESGFSHEEATRKIHVIYNGFDLADYSESPSMLDTEFTMLFSGIFHREGSPDNLWHVLGEIARENEEFRKDLKILFIGRVDTDITDLITSEGLADNLDLMGYLPHRQTTVLQQSARVLILPLRKQPEAMAILPGKLYEYLATRRPILSFGPEGCELGTMLSRAGAGQVFDWDETERLKEKVLQLYADYCQHREQKVNTDELEDRILCYTRESETVQMSKLVKEIIKK